MLGAMMLGAMVKWGVGRRLVRAARRATERAAAGRSPLWSGRSDRAKSPGLRTEPEIIYRLRRQALTVGRTGSSTLIRRTVSRVRRFFGEITDIVAIVIHDSIVLDPGFTFKARRTAS